MYGEEAVMYKDGSVLDVAVVSVKRLLGQSGNTNRRSRLDRLASHIRGLEADIVGVCDIWDLDLALALAAELGDRYPHHSLERFDIGDLVRETAEDTLGSTLLGSFLGTVASVGVAAVASARRDLETAVNWVHPSGRHRKSRQPRRLRSGLMLMSALSLRGRPRFFPARSRTAEPAADAPVPGVLIADIQRASGDLGVFLCHARAAWHGKDPKQWDARDELLHSLIRAYRLDNPDADITILLDHRSDGTDGPHRLGVSESDTALTVITPRPYSLVELALAARVRVAAVADDPHGRYGLREQWYETWGRGTLTDQGYGRSELDFLQWEIDRGVLNPIDHPHAPGSRWWRGMQEQYAYFAELASSIYKAGLPKNGLCNAIVAWLDYLDAPSAESWYRAHNVNIIRGYLDWTRTAQAEAYPEQLFMNKILSRLLFAQAMIEGQAFGLVGELAADPRLLSVDLLLELDDVYPCSYPLTPVQVDHLGYRGPGLTDDLAMLLDRWLMPCLLDIYKWAAHHNNEPDLGALVIDGAPVYPHQDWYAERIAC